MILEVMCAALSDARTRAAWEEYALILASIGRLQQLSALCEVETAKLPTVCAWCLAEQGLPLGTCSHGICQAHADGEYATLQAKRAARLARARVEGASK